MAGSAALTLVAWYRARAWKPYLNRPYWILAPMTGMILAVVTPLILIAVGTGREAALRSRNFYGVLRLTRPRALSDGWSIPMVPGNSLFSFKQRAT